MTYYAFMGSEDTKGGVPFLKREAKVPPDGVQMLWGARGRVESLSQREAKVPWRGANFMEGPGGGFRNTSP